jgi:PucR family transcriptional regulator, proline-responsive transcriptional activator
MALSLEMVAEALKKYSPEAHISMKDHFIETVTLLDQHQASFEAEILYIGKASDLAKIPALRSPINLLCVYDSPILQEYNEFPGLNLITVSNQANVASLCQEVRNLLNARRQYDQASLKLFDALLSEKGLRHILDTGFKILGNPLLVFDAALTLIGYSPRTEINDPTWQEVIEIGYLSLEVVKTSHTLEAVKILAENDVPLISRYFHEQRWLFCRITISDRFIGMVGVMEYEKPIEEKESEIIQLVSRTVSCEMQKESFLGYSRGIADEFLIADLLSGRLSNRAIIQERVSSLALSVKENLYLIVIRDVKNSPENLKFPYLRRLLENTLSGSMAVIYKGNIVLLISREKKKPLGKDELNSITGILKEVNLVGGISRCFHNIEDIREYYNQSSDAIKLGLRLNKTMENLLFYYEDYAFYHLMDIAGSQKDLTSFCNPLFLDLIKYDRKNNTDFTRSLYSYLSNGNSTKESAFILGIHRNTMDYRINKIQEILNINLKDPNISWSLNFSFKIFELMGNMDLLQDGS